MQLFRFLAAAIVIAATSFAPEAAATPPRTLNYQGFLTSAANAPIDTPVQMTFNLYSVPTGGVALWTETQPSVAVAKGEFNTILGNVTPLSLAFDVPYYLGVQVGTDPEMAPRQPLAASAYAFRALSIDSGAVVPGTLLTGAITAATIGGSQVTGPITTATIGGSQVTGDLSGASNIDLGASTASSGNIVKNGVVFLHDFGVGNVFLGEPSGNFTMTGIDNTGLGDNTLVANTTGALNTAAGNEALSSNSTGDRNTAAGGAALDRNTSGTSNTAVGASALFSNTTGGQNTALGDSTLAANTTASDNTALGFAALESNTIGGGSTAVGNGALFNNTTGSQNVAVGASALINNTSGVNNIALGSGAGSAVTTGNNSIVIGNAGLVGDSEVIRIGTQGTQTTAFMAGVRGAIPGGAVAVMVGPTGQLGVALSSRKVKEDIADMADASSVLAKLRPVAFRYKDHPDWTRQYGLIAEEVSEVAPDLAARSQDGAIETVYYQFLAPMLLNEYQKQLRVNAEQHARLEALEREVMLMKKKLGLD